GRRDPCRSRRHDCRGDTRSNQQHEVTNPVWVALERATRISLHVRGIQMVSQAVQDVIDHVKKHWDGKEDSYVPCSNSWCDGSMQVFTTLPHLIGTLCNKCGNGIEVNKTEVLE